MKVDLNQKVKGLDGKETDTNIGQVIAQALSMEREGDALKLWTWAQNFYNGVSVEMDKSDFKAFRDLITKPNKFAVIVQAQVIEILDEAEKQVKKAS